MSEPTGRRADPMERLDSTMPGGNRSLRSFVSVLHSAMALVWRAGPRSFLAAAALQVLGAATAMVLVLAGKLAVDAILDAQRGAASVTDLVPVLLLTAAVTAIGTASTSLQNQQERLLGEHASAAVWEQLLDVTGRVQLEFFESPRFFEHLKRVELNAVLRPLVVTTGVLGLIGGAIGTVGLLVVLLGIEPLLVPALLAAGVPTLLLTRRASVSEFDFAVRSTPAIRSRDYLRGLLAGRDAAKEVRAFGAERLLRDRHDTAAGAYLADVGRQVRRRQLYALAAVVASSAVLTGSLALLVYFISTDRITISEGGAAVIGIRLLAGRLDQLLGSAGTLFESSVFLRDLDHFLSLAVVAEPPGSGRRAPHTQAITLDGVGYTYPGSNEPAVEDISLRIEAGEVVALVGENGSGKTTLAKLIAGLYRPTAGVISWDGVDVAALPPADVRRSVAVIFQDFVRYQLSALENIGLGEPDEVDDEPAARRAAVEARAEFIQRLPLGYRTVLSREYADGRDLSVGQWQRVALARAFRRDAPLIILDEPTASLDPRAENELFADVRRLLHGRSALLISHRYSTVRAAHRIYVLEAGHVAESGTHDELMARDGSYAELFRLQAGAYL